MVEFYLLTFPRFPLRKKEHKSYFGKNRTHDFRTSRCAAYLLDHSGDERLYKEIITNADPIYFSSPSEASELVQGKRLQIYIMRSHAFVASGVVVAPL